MMYALQGSGMSVSLALDIGEVLVGKAWMGWMAMGGEISDRTEIGAVTIAPGGEDARVCASSLFLHP